MAQCLDVVDCIECVEGCVMNGTVPSIDIERCAIPAFAYPQVIPP